MMPRVHERYRIIEKIGEGGTGAVYRAEDSVTGDTVALKIIPRTGGTNLHGEFLAMARLHHENILGVFDYGITEDGDDFFTMELVTGPSLDTAIAEIPSEQFYRFIAGILRALAFVHARGMVHADIKPSNILIDESLLADEPEKAARLADFGLSAALDDPTATTARGTFPYAAPEVYASRLDARSDLYALGVVLYELVTGSRPFAGDNVAEVLREQRRGPPKDPRELKDDVPDGLAELILGLLDPAPGARPQTADEVLTRINELAGTDFEVAGALPLLDIGATLVGRERDLAALEHIWLDAQMGRGGVALISGEEGIGKSRLLAELKLKVQLAGGRVRLLKPTLESLTGDSLRAELYEESRFGLAERTASELLAHKDPTLLIVDDAQLADGGTVEILAYLARAVSVSQVALCIATDIDALDKSKQLQPLAVAVDRAERGLRLNLAPIDRTSLRQLVTNSFSAEIAEKLSDDLHRSSSGNPAHAARALETLVSEKIIARERGRWVLREESPTIPLPADAAVAAMDRFRSLDESAREILPICALLGSNFTRTHALRVLSNLGTDLNRNLDTALATAITGRLLVADVAAGSFRFGHVDLALELSKSLDGQRQQAIHRAAATALLDADGEPPAETLALHYLALADEDNAAKWGLKAVEKRVNDFDHHGALAWLERTLPFLKDTAKTEALEQAGTRAEIVGDIEKACRHLEAALAGYADDIAARVRTAGRLGELRRRVGQTDEGLELLMRSLEDARSAGLVSSQIATHLRIAKVLWYMADYTAALEHAVAGQLLAQSAHDRRADADLARVRGTIETSRGNTKEALELLESALDTAVSIDDELLVANVRLDLGRTAVHSGDYGRAVSALTSSLEVYERRGHIEVVARLLNNLAAAYYFQGDWARARTAWERFVQLCERLDERSELVTALNNVGSLLRDLGELTDATAALERGAAVAEEVGHASMGAMILGNRGEVLFRQGDLATARACIENALSQFVQFGATEYIVENKRRLCEISLATGRVSETLDRVITLARTAKDAGAKLEEGIVLRVACSALTLQGDLDSAVWFGERSREILAKLGARFEVAKLDVECGELALKRGDNDKARESFEAAIETFTELGARWDLSRTRKRQRALMDSGTATAVSSQGFGILIELAHASTQLSLDKLLETTVDKLLDVTGFERGFILLVDDDGRPRERTRRVRAGAAPFHREDAEFSGSIVRRAAGKCESIAISDISGEADLAQQKSVISLGLRQVMCVPLQAHGRVIGVVYIDSRSQAPMENVIELPVLEALAAQIALAVENSRLHAEERRKGDLMSILAHEIRNPLSGILGYSSMGESGRYQLGTDATEFFSRIRREGERLRRLVDNILELARHEAGKVDWSFDSFELTKLIDVAVESYGAVEGKDIKFVVETDGLSDKPYGNADRLTQVLVNLIGNAVKFTPEGGTITIRAFSERVLPSDPDAPPTPATDLVAWAPVDPGEADPRDFVRVDVADTGPGMSEAVRSRLFRKFSQGTGKRGGVGLGLYISREIISRHGGTIWVTSEPGKGATFSFRIPIAP